MPTIFETCEPRPEILAGQLPDSIFAADLWDVVAGKAHPGYAEPEIRKSRSAPIHLGGMEFHYGTIWLYLCLQ